MSPETMRDRIAMAALQGWLAHPGGVPTTERMAQRCYEYADALLAARGGDAPQPQPAKDDAVKQQMLRALKALHRWADGKVCRHEDTHRGGTIWEICDQCGERWADDEGGKPRFELPDCIVDAEFAIAAAEKEQSA